MSYSVELKREVAVIEPNGQDEAISELSAIIRNCGEITRNSLGEKIVVITEIEEVCAMVNHMLFSIYGKKAEKKVSHELAFSKKLFELVFPIDITRQVFLDCEIVKFDENKYLNFESG